MSLTNKAIVHDQASAAAVSLMQPTTARPTKLGEMAEHDNTADSLADIGRR
jgi:hypothetical protein